MQPRAEALHWRSAAMARRPAERHTARKLFPPAGQTISTKVVEGNNLLLIRSDKQSRSSQLSRRQPQKSLSSSWCPWLPVLPRKCQCLPKRGYRSCCGHSPQPREPRLGNWDAQDRWRREISHFPSFTYRLFSSTICCANCIAYDFSLFRNRASASPSYPCCLGGLVASSPLCREKV